MQRLSAPQIVLALDVDTFEKAQELVGNLYPRIKLFKIGSQLFTSCGPEAVKMVGAKGGRVFLDLKFHDIPNTVFHSVASGTTAGYSKVTISYLTGISGKAQAAVTPPVFMMTVHIKGGRPMLEAAVRGAAEKAKKLGIEKPLIVGVTRLTSDEDSGDTAKEVLQAARLAKDSGLDGVVCSALEAMEVRKECGVDFVIVTPGIRSDKDVVDDQKRIVNVKQAVKAGSNFLVIGRPILEAADPIAKTEELLGELLGGVPYGAGN